MSYWRDLSERVLASFAGGVLATLPVEAFDVMDVSWGTSLGIGAGAAVVSLLKGVAAKWTGDPNSAGLGI